MSHAVPNHDRNGEPESILGRDALFDLRRQGDLIKARCSGSHGDIYSVRSSGTDGGESFCTCPNRQPCEHVQALLLLWRRAPRLFAQIEDIETALRGRPAEDQVALLREIIRRQPELETGIENRLGIRPKELPPPPGDRFHRTIEMLLAHAAHTSSFGIAERLEGVRRVGDEYLDSGLLEHAAAVYFALADQLSTRLFDFHDCVEDLVFIAEDAVRQMGICLARAAGAGREGILRRLFDLLVVETTIGGAQLDQPICAILRALTIPAERLVVASWVRSALRPFFPGQMHPALAGLLLDLDGDGLGEAVYLDLCHRTKRRGDLVTWLLRRHRFEDALIEIRSAKDAELPALADSLVQTGRVAVAEAVVIERLRAVGAVGLGNGDNLVEWLKRFYIDRKRPQLALKRARQLLLICPALDRWREVQTLAELLGQWPEVREELLVRLTEMKAFYALAQIHLSEGAIELAIRAAEEVGDSYGIVLEVARAAEEYRPEAALRIYGRHAESLIEQKKRSRYREACEVLLRMREIHRGIADEAGWERYVGGLYSMYGARHALMDEMRAAGLV